MPATGKRKLSAAAGINWLFDNFDYNLHTLVFVGRKPEGKTHSPVRVFTKEERQKALEQSITYNEKGYDVYFMVNPGDGVTHEGKKVPRSHESVIHLERLFMDTDSCPIEKVQDYLYWLNIQPHFTIESSPGKFHLHFHIEQEEKTPKNILQWKAIQSIMHRLGDASIKNPAKTLGTDSTMSDYAKILRIPGFFHIEKKTEVKLIASSDLPAYRLEDLFTLTKAQEYLDYNQEKHGTTEPSNVPSLTDTEVLNKGERFQALQSLALHLANTNSPYNDKLGTFTLFARHRIDNSDNIYVDENHTLTDKSLSLFNSATNKVSKEQLQVQVESLRSSTTDEEHSPWHLPDSFYLSAPNGFGDVVSQVMRFSLYPCAALSFGVFLTGLSILKSKTHLTPHGSSPALYTLNVAIAGYGKGDPMTLLQNMFVANGMTKLISNEIRSDRGLYMHLNSNDGTALCILDEVAPLFKAMQKENANGHIANIAKAFLSLFSAGALKGLSLGKLASSNSTKGEKEIILDNPMLAICGFTVPSEFFKMFSLESVAKGLFQRFIPIVPNLTFTCPNPEADKAAVIKSPLFDGYMCQDATELDSDGNPVPDLITQARVKMQYTSEASEYFDNLSREYRHKLIDYAIDEDKQHLSGLYSRLAEQIERVATVLSPEIIDLATLTWAHRFIESRHLATMEQVRTGGIVSNEHPGNRNSVLEDRILCALGKVASLSNDNIAFKSDLYKRVRKSFNSLKEFNQLITDMASLDKIELVNNYRGPKSTNNKPGTGIRLGDVLDD